MIPQRATNLSLKGKVLDMASELGMNTSQTVDALQAKEVTRRYWKRWKEENKEAVAEYNARIAREGLPLAKYRSFGQRLGDGLAGERSDSDH